MRKENNIIYIGDHFYMDSGMRMSPLYSIHGERWDYGLIRCALERGEIVHIRPATRAEIYPYEQRLKTLQQERAQRDAANHFE
jgi:hypothetical protein